MAAHILRDLGVSSVALLTNNPAKHACLRAHGIAVTERLPLLPPPAGGNGAAAPHAPHAAAPTEKRARGSRNGAEPHFV